VSREIFSIAYSQLPKREHHTMKIIVRSLVIALAVSGAIATSYSSAASAKATVKVSKTSAMPTPTCPPNSGTTCGMDNW
jgi:hypothetical protein